MLTSLSAQKHQVGMRYTAPNYILGLDKVPTPLEGAKSWGRGLEVEYQRRINPNFLIGIPLRLTQGDGLRSVADFGVDPINPDIQVKPVSAFGAGLQLVIEPIAKASFFDPQFFAGFGVFNDFDGNTIPEVPLGVNLNINLGSYAYLSPHLSYRLALGDQSDIRRNLQAGLGVHFQFDVEPPPPPPPPVIDTDGDGIPDSEDQCPTEAGPLELLGCPDSDGDGIADKNDKCPDIAGTAAFMGCVDTDGDGIADPDDECPNEPGIAANGGCPLSDRDGDGVPDKDDLCPDRAGTVAMSGCPDTDGDGVSDRDDDCPREAGTAAMRGCPDSDGDGLADRDDKCPKQAGPRTNQGCPEITQEDREVIEFAIQNINFETGSARLAVSSRGVLDQVEDILRRYPGYKLAIGGHTDSVGSEELNQRLSEQRANSVYDYLVEKGINAARMSYKGFGESMPIADNRYKDGREQNRRVTLDLMIE
jgi:outer membrane protein OmpA-like peptidoglycan-associated protein